MYCTVRDPVLLCLSNKMDPLAFFVCMFFLGVSLLILCVGLKLCSALVNSTPPRREGGEEISPATTVPCSGSGSEFTIGFTNESTSELPSYKEATKLPTYQEAVCILEKEIVLCTHLH